MKQEQVTAYYQRQVVSVTTRLTIASLALDNFSVKAQSLTQASMFLKSGPKQKPTESGKQQASTSQVTRINTSPSCTDEEHFLLVLYGWCLHILALQNTCKVSWTVKK